MFLIEGFFRGNLCGLFSNSVEMIQLFERSIENKSNLLCLICSQPKLLYFIRDYWMPFCNTRFAYCHTREQKEKQIKLAKELIREEEEWLQEQFEIDYKKQITEATPLEKQPVIKVKKILL